MSRPEHNAPDAGRSHGRDPDPTRPARAATNLPRPAVSVVVPFAGSGAEALTVLAMLRALRTALGDELILSDNSGTAPPFPPAASTVPGAPPFPPAASTVPGAPPFPPAASTVPGAPPFPPAASTVPGAPPAAPAAGAGARAPLTVVRAMGEASAAHARNVGAAHAHNDWLLFLDSDVRPPADLLDRFFGEAIDPHAGAVTGDIAGIPDTRTLAARYGTARNFLGQRSHVMNPLRPRASSANLLVRRAAFEQVGGYTEGIWAAEDTDFTWRLQERGWALAFNPRAVVQHEYRSSLRALGRQWRGYAAGARWLSQRYPDFKPDPGLNRGARILLERVGIGSGVAFRADGRHSEPSASLTRFERLQFLFVQCYLAVEEQIGLRMSNQVRPRKP